MRRAIFLLFVIIVGFGTTLFLSKRSTNGQVSEITYDFGTARQDEKLRHIFRVENRSGQAARISAVRATCGCTTVESPDATIDPMGHADIPVDINLTGRPENFRSWVTLTFDSGRSLRLIVQGRVIQQYPTRVTFSPILRGERPVKEFSIVPLPGTALHVQTVRFNSSILSVSSSPSPGGPRIEVSPARNIGYGEFSDVVEIETDDTIAPVKRIQVSGVIRPRVEVEPSGRMVSMLGSGEKKTVSVKLRSPYSERISVQSISISPVGSVTFDAPEVPAEGNGVVIPLHATGTVAPGRIVSSKISISVLVGDSMDRVPLEWYVMGKRE